MTLATTTVNNRRRMHKLTDVESIFHSSEISNLPHERNKIEYIIPSQIARHTHMLIILLVLISSIYFLTLINFSW